MTRLFIFVIALLAITPGTDFVVELDGEFFNEKFMPTHGWLCPWDRNDMPIADRQRCSPARHLVSLA